MLQRVIWACAMLSKLVGLHHAVSSIWSAPFSFRYGKVNFSLMRTLRRDVSYMILSIKTASQPHFITQCRGLLNDLILEGIPGGIQSSNVAPLAAAMNPMVWTPPLWARLNPLCTHLPLLGSNPAVCSHHGINSSHMHTSTDTDADT